MSEALPEYLLQVDNLTKHYPVHGGIFFRLTGKVHALNGVSFNLRSGETLGIVGESGCGKSTLGKTLLRLHHPTGGTVLFNGIDLCSLSGREMTARRKDLQMIFQDPYESLNPRHTVGDILEEPFVIHGVGDTSFRRNEVLRLLKRVGLPENAINRFPHEFSGGQRQRIGVARAIALKPKIVVCDEPASALDVSVQSQVLNLLMELQEEMKLTYIFISHALPVVKLISDRVMVMYLGKIMEFTDSQTIYEKPYHPYTMALISAIPEPDPEKKGNRIILEGDIPSSHSLPTGCPFASRCAHATSLCRNTAPALDSAPGTAGDSHLVACHYAGKIKL